MKVTIVSIALLACICLTACRARNRDVIVVSVLVDADSASFKTISDKLVEFGAQKHWTASGKGILAASVLLSSPRYQDYLANHPKAIGADVIVLPSPEVEMNPVLKQDASRAHNACGSMATCPAFIPPWVKGEKLDAAKQVLTALTMQ